jgi:Ca2+-dependent lipid-binding protein
MTKKLEVQIIECKNLAIRDINGSSDPYCKKNIFKKR